MATNGRRYEANFYSRIFFKQICELVFTKLKYSDKIPIENIIVKEFMEHPVHYVKGGVVSE